MGNLGREEKNTYPHPSDQQRRSLRETWPGVPIPSVVRPFSAFTETPSIAEMTGRFTRFGANSRWYQMVCFRSSESCIPRTNYTSRPRDSAKSPDVLFIPLKNPDAKPRQGTGPPISQLSSFGFRLIGYRHHRA